MDIEDLDTRELLKEISSFGGRKHQLTFFRTTYEFSALDRKTLHDITEKRLKRNSPTAMYWVLRMSSISDVQLIQLVEDYINRNQIGGIMEILLRKVVLTGERISQYKAWIDANINHWNVIEQIVFLAMNFNILFFEQFRGYFEKIVKQPLVEAMEGFDAEKYHPFARPYIYSAFQTIIGALTQLNIFNDKKLIEKLGILAHKFGEHAYKDFARFKMFVPFIKTSANIVTAKILTYEGAIETGNDILDLTEYQEALKSVLEFTWNIMDERKETPLMVLVMSSTLLRTCYYNPDMANIENYSLFVKRFINTIAPDIFPRLDPATKLLFYDVIMSTEVGMAILLGKETSKEMLLATVEEIQSFIGSFSDLRAVHPSRLLTAVYNAYFYKVLAREQWQRDKWQKITETIKRCLELNVDIADIVIVEMAYATILVNTDLRSNDLKTTLNKLWTREMLDKVLPNLRPMYLEKIVKILIIRQLEVGDCKKLMKKAIELLQDFLDPMDPYERVSYDLVIVYIMALKFMLGRRVDEELLKWRILSTKLVYGLQQRRSVTERIMLYSLVQEFADGDNFFTSIKKSDVVIHLRKLLERSQEEISSKDLFPIQYSVEDVLSPLGFIDKMPRNPISMSATLEKREDGNFLVVKVGALSALPIRFKLREISVDISVYNNGWKRLNTQLKSFKSMLLSTNTELETLRYEFPIQTSHPINLLSAKVRLDVEKLERIEEFFLISTKTSFQKKANEIWEKLSKGTIHSAIPAPIIVEVNNLENLVDDLPVPYSHAETADIQILGMYDHTNHMVFLDRSSVCETILVHELMHVMQYYSKFGNRWYVTTKIHKLPRSLMLPMIVDFQNYQEFREGIAVLAEFIHGNEEISISPVYQSYFNNVLARFTQWCRMNSRSGTLWDLICWQEEILNK